MNVATKHFITSLVPHVSTSGTSRKQFRDLLNILPQSYQVGQALCLDHTELGSVRSYRKQYPYPDSCHHIPLCERSMGSWRYFLHGDVHL